jgi:hydrogenase maturation protease
MNLTLVEPIVNAMLYEGYMLYPYRPSSVKNRQRWTFGGVYPQAYSQAQRGADAWAVQTECLVVGAESARIDLKLRFLHLLARQIGELRRPLPNLPQGSEPDFRVVPALQVGQTLHQTWQEAVERDFDIADLPLSDLHNSPQHITFAFPGARTLEPMHDPEGMVVGVVVREQQHIEGTIELAVERAGDQTFKLTICVANRTPLEQSAQLDRDTALLRSFASTHLVLGVQGGEFISLFDPPEQLREAAGSCRNSGLWPVLVGDATMLLAAPIILYDYPQVAPESPGDLFDGTEIDEILTLRILTMTEEEKHEMRATDARARSLLERTEALAREQLLGLHGTVRDMRSLEQAP